MSLKLHTRYARSLLSLSVGTGVIDRVHQDMDLLHRTCCTSRDFVQMLKSPIVHGDKKFTVLKKLFADRVSAMVMEFFRIVVSKGREAHLPEIAAGFLRQYNAYKGIVPARLVTAVPVEERLLKTFRTVLEKQTAKDIALEAQVDSAIIGGFVLSVEDKLYDASISRHLGALKKEFRNNEFVKKF